MPLTENGKKEMLEAQLRQLRGGRDIPKGEVGCKICNKSIYRVFVEHIQEHLSD